MKKLFWLTLLLGITFLPLAANSEDASSAVPYESAQQKMFNLLLKRLETADTIERQREVAKDLLTYGDLLDDRVQTDLKIKFYDTLLNHFVRTTDEVIVANVAEAQISKALALGNNHHDDEAIALIDDFSQRYGQHKQTPYPELFTYSYIAKGYFLAEHKGKYDEAIQSYQEILKQSSTYPADAVVLHFRVTEALFLIAEIQEKQNKLPEAAASLEEIEKRYANSTSEDLKNQIEKARYKRGRLLEQMNNVN